MESPVNQLPSKVMSDSYNNKIAKFVKYKEKDIDSWDFQTDDDDNTFVVVTMKDGETREIPVKRYDLTELLCLPDESEITLETTGEFGSLEEVQEQLIQACQLSQSDNELLYSIEFKHTLLFWINRGCFVPPQEISVTELGIVPETSYMRYSVKAKQNSLGFTGSVDTVVRDIASSKPPTEVIEPDYDLADLAWPEASGIRRVVRPSSPVALSQDEIDEILNELRDEIRYSYPDINNINLQVNAITVTDGTDLVITNSDQSKNAPVQGTITIQVRATRAHDLSSYSNTEDGVIMYDYSTSYGIMPTVEQAGRQVLELIQLDERNIVEYENPLRITDAVFEAAREDDVIVEGYETIHFVPPAGATEYTMVGEMTLHIRYVESEQMPAKLQLSYLDDLSRGTIADDTGAHVRRWAVPTGYDVDTERLLILKELYTRLNDERSETVYPDFDRIAMIVDENNKATFYGKGSARYNDVLGINYIQLVEDASLNGVDRNITKLNVGDTRMGNTSYYPERYRYYPTQEALDAGFYDQSILREYLNEIDSKVSSPMTDEDYSVRFNEWNRSVDLEPNWGYAPSKIRGKISILGIVSDPSDLAKVNLKGITRTYTSQETYEQVVAENKAMLKFALEQSGSGHVELAELEHSIVDDNQIAFKLADGASLTTAALTGTYIAPIAKEYITDYKLNLGICSNNGTWGEWTHPLTSLESVTTEPEYIVNQVFNEIRATVAPNGPMVSTLGLEHVVVGNDIIISGGNSTGSLTIKNYVSGDR